MKKVFYFAIAFAALSLNSCGSKTENANNTPTEQPAPEKGPHHGPEGRPGCPGDPKEMIQKRVDKMAEDLNLSDEQKQKLTEIFTQQAEKCKAAAEAKKEEAKENMKAMHEEEMAAIKSVLTAEQAAKLDTMKFDCPKGGPRPEGPGHDGPRPEGPHHGCPGHDGPGHDGPRPEK